MRVYFVKSDGEERVVEAASFSRAIAVFNAAMLAEYGADSGWTHDSEPESVQIISDEPVVR